MTLLTIIFDCFKRNKQFLKKISSATKVANVLIGEVDFLDETTEQEIVVLVRLSKPLILELTEVVLPTKYMFTKG